MICPDTGAAIENPLFSFIAIISFLILSKHLASNAAWGYLCIVACFIALFALLLCNNISIFAQLFQAVFLSACHFPHFIQFFFHETRHIAIVLYISTVQYSDSGVLRRIFNAFFVHSPFHMFALFLHFCLHSFFEKQLTFILLSSKIKESKPIPARRKFKQ